MMNERIKQLAEQSLHNVKYWNEQLTKGNTPPNGRAVTLDELEQFAELLIKECAELCQQVTDSGEFSPSQQYASAACRNQIKEHFGVE